MSTTCGLSSITRILAAGVVNVIADGPHRPKSPYFRAVAAGALFDSSFSATGWGSYRNSGRTAEQYREGRARRLLTRCWRSLRRPLGPHQAKTVCSVPVGGLAASRRARLRPPDAAHLIGQLTHGSASPNALTPCATPPSLLGSRPGG